MSGQRPPGGGPPDRDGLLAIAVGHHQSGRLDEAEAVYHALLRRWPEDSDALHYLGLATFQRGDTARAVSLLERSLQQRPDNVAALNNLGNLRKAAGRLDEAEAAYRRALELEPGHADALSNLGLVLKATGRLAEAIDALDAAVVAEPRHATAQFNRGNLLSQLGRVEEAIGAFRRTLAVYPEHVPALKALGIALYRAGRAAEAAVLYRQLLEISPDNPVALHMLAACTGEAVPPRASDDYVRSVFDAMAGAFDDHLAHLGYRAPALVREAVARALGDPRGALDALDAGCGTGLCASWLRGYARRLVGVDLSPGMLERAIERGVYDALVEAELTRYLGLQPAGFDLVASADTLVYFGDLDAVATAVFQALRPDGLFAFTVEHLEDAVGACFRLQPHGRYAHAEDYVRKVLAQAGFDPVEVAREPLRREAGSPVAGLVIAARRPPARRARGGDSGGGR